MREVIRVATLLVAAIACAAPAFMDFPEELPSVALGSAALLYVERGLALFAASLFALVVVVRAWSGELPTTLSQHGVGWSETAAVIEQAAKALEVDLATSQTRLDTLERDVGELRKAIRLKP